MDIFGRDVKKDSISDTRVGDFAYRLLVPVNVRKKPSITLVDQWLFNYNNAHPDKPYFPSLPRSKFTIGGKEVQMTEEEYHDFLRERGNFVVEHLGNISIDAENPSELDRMKLDKLFDYGSNWAKAQMLKQKRQQEQGK